MTSLLPRYVMDVQVAEDFVFGGVTHLRAGEFVTVERVESVLARLGLLKTTTNRPHLKCTACEEDVRFHRASQPSTPKQEGQRQRSQPAYFQRVRDTHRKPCFYALSREERAEYERELKRRLLPDAPTRLLPPVPDVQDGEGSGHGLRGEPTGGAADGPEEQGERSTRLLGEVYEAFWARVGSLKDPGQADIREALDGLWITLPDGEQHHYADAFYGLMANRSDPQTPQYFIWCGRIQTVQHYIDGSLLHLAPVRKAPGRLGVVVLERERLNRFGQWTQVQQLLSGDLRETPSLFVCARRTVSADGSRVQVIAEYAQWLCLGHHPWLRAPEDPIPVFHEPGTLHEARAVWGQAELLPVEESTEPEVTLSEVEIVSPPLAAFSSAEAGTKSEPKPFASTTMPVEKARRSTSPSRQPTLERMVRWLKTVLRWPW